MLSIICYIVAGLLFLLAGFNQKLFSQPELDEIAFGLFFLVLAWALSGFGPPITWGRRGE
jgi:hypothetical protein